jgi:hypothetical protein
MSSWKDKNFNKKIKVSQSTIDSLNRGGNFNSNFSRLKSSMDPSQREAMNRYYGKDKVDAAYAKWQTEGKAKRDAAAPKRNFKKANPEVFSSTIRANPGAKPQANAKDNFKKANPEVFNPNRVIGANPSAHPEFNAESNFKKANPDVVAAAKKRAIDRVTATVNNGPRKPMR